VTSRLYGSDRGAGSGPRDGLLDLPDQEHRATLDDVDVDAVAGR
jgi:hypothetical protein